MSNVIRIKRRASGSAGAPSSLMDSELAYNQVDDTIWIGKGTGGAGGSATTIEAIAGKGAFLALAGSQVVTGDKEFSGAIDFSGTIEIDGVELTATAAELNKLAGVTQGVASPGKALIVDSSKDLDLDGGDLTVANFTASGNVVISGNLTVNGATTVINSTTVSVDDKLIELGSTASPSDATADGGGIVLKGTTDKSIIFTDATDSWDLSEHANLASGKEYKINGASVLSSDSLGSGVVNSSLESVGVLSAGTWEADTIAIAHGGTGETSAQAAINALSQVSGATAGHVLTKVGSDAVWAAPADTGISSLNGLTSDSQTFAVGTSGTDFNISSASGVHTFNIPSASATNRGLVTTSAQTFAGPKTFQAAASTQVPVTIKMASGQSVNVFRVLTDTNVPVLTVNQFGQIASNTHFVAPGAGTDPAFVAVQAAGGQTGNLMEFRNSAQTAVVGAIDKDGNFAVGGYKGQTIAVAYGGTGATTAAGARSNLDAQQAGANLEAIRGLTSASNKLPYFTGSGTADVTDLTSFGRSLVGTANAAAAQAVLELEPGVDVQAYDSRLQALADLSGSFSAGVVNLVGYSASSTAEFVETSAFGRSLIDDADASTARTTLGLAIGTDVQAQDAKLSAISSASVGADDLLYFTSSSAVAATTLSSFGRSLIDDADAASARTTLGLVVGSDVMGYDPELAALAGLVSDTDKMPYFTGSGTAAVADFTSFGRSLVDDNDAEDARSTLGLESMAVQPASGVAITGGSIADVSLTGVELDGGSF
jgi:hypothetical protein